jgi:hypothetical protein
MDAGDAFSELNEAFYPLTLVVPIALLSMLAALTAFAYARGGSRSGRWLKGYLATVYLILTFPLAAITLAQLAVPPLALSTGFGVVAAICFAGLLGLDIKGRTTEVAPSSSLPHRVVGALLMAVGGGGYQVLQVVLLGASFPGIVILGLCPLTIFLIGLQVCSYPKWNRRLLALASPVAILGGAAMVLQGIYIDLLYLLAGVVGLVALLRG